MSELRRLLAICNWNNEVEIGDVLTEAEKHQPKENIVVVDDGSTDRSGQIARERGFRVIFHDVNYGVGAAVRSGLNYGRDHGYDYVVIIASNGKMMPSEIERVSEPIVAGRADFVQGSRYEEGGDSPGLTLFRRFAIPAFSLFSCIFYRRWFRDVTCGYRAVSVKILKDSRMDLQQRWLDKYELETYLVYWACRLGYRIEEAPVTMHYSHLKKGRVSKIKPFVGWWSVMRPLFLLELGLKR